MTVEEELRNTKRLRFAIMREYGMSERHARRVLLSDVPLMLEHLKPPARGAAETPLEATLEQAWGESDARGAAALAEAEAILG